MGEENPEPVVTPDEVSSMAKYLGIDLADGKDFYLLSAAKEAVVAPVLQPWEEMEDESGNPYFYNHQTRQSTRRHPLDAKFLQLVQKLRSKGMPGGSETRTWMRFEGEGGKVFHYNFKDGSTADECPADAEIEPVAPEMVPQYDPSQLRADGQHSGLTDESVASMKTLMFYAWWSDSKEEPDRGNGFEAGGGLAKRYVTALFDIDASSFTVKMDNDAEVVLTSLTSVTAKHGMPVQAWDLHVGARLNLLGKPTTLMQASASTLRWLDYHAKALRKQKAKLIKDLGKYETRSLPQAVVFEKGQKVKGGTSLRALMEQIEVLRGMLGKWRPGM